MNLIATIIVGAFGAGLIAAGLFYQAQYRKLQADAVLIGGCYLFGGVLLATCVV